MISLLSRRVSEATQPRARGRLTAFAFALGCTFLPSSAFSQGTCSDLNRTIFPWYLGRATGTAYICDGSNFQTFLTATASPRQFGMGTATPGAGLDVQFPETAASGAAYGVRYQQTLTAAANGDALTALYINPTFTNGAFTGVANNGLIVASGNVGIGTTTPGAMLYVNGSSTSATPFIVNTPSGFIGTLLSLQVNGTPVFQGSVVNGSGTSYFTFGSGVNGSSGVNIISADGYGTGLSFSPGPGNATEWSFGSGPSPYNLVLTNYAGANVMSWAESTGNVGIGTASPAAPLHVAGEAIVGNTGLACSSTTAGALRWNNSTGYVEMCNGTNWTAFAANPPTGCTGPSSFSFTNATNQSLSTVVTSNTVTPSGCGTFNLSAYVSGGGSPQISINGGAWASSGAWSPGQTIAVRLTSSGSVSTTLSAVVQIGSTTGTTWTVTTLGGQTKIFGTVNGYNGNLGGLSGADAICMSEANALGYAGNWKAVLSTSTVDAASRLTILYPVVLASDGSTVAAANLWNTISEPDARNEFSWTGSIGTGTYSGYSCNDWTDGTSSYYGQSGIGSLTGYYLSTWLDYSYYPCYNNESLYCVNQ